MAILALRTFRGHCPKAPYWERTSFCCPTVPPVWTPTLALQ